MDEEKIKKRTRKQNNSLHLYYELLAKELNESGLTMRVVLKPEVEIEWTKETVKKHLWAPVQQLMLLKESTTELTTGEINKVYEVIDRHLGEKFGFHMDFPHDPLPGIEIK